MFLHVMVKLVSSPLNFHLEQYEGPLDLLLDLIRKQQINIYDIPIAKITAQYLDYMQKAMELDIETQLRFRLHGGDADSYQEPDAVAARSGARQDRSGRRSAQGTRRPSDRARTLQERRGDAAAEAGDRRSNLVESADGRSLSAEDEGRG